eukprot:14070_2
MKQKMEEKRYFSFLAEIMLLREVNHPSILKFHGACVNPPTSVLWSLRSTEAKTFSTQRCRSTIHNARPSSHKLQMRCDISTNETRLFTATRVPMSWAAAPQSSRLETLGLHESRTTRQPSAEQRLGLHPRFRADMERRQTCSALASCGRFLAASDHTQRKTHSSTSKSLTVFVLPFRRELTQESRRRNAGTTTRRSDRASRQCMTSSSRCKRVGWGQPIKTNGRRRAVFVLCLGNRSIYNLLITTHTHKKKKESQKEAHNT